MRNGRDSWRFYAAVAVNGLVMAGYALVKTYEAKAGWSWATEVLSWLAPLPGLYALHLACKAGEEARDADVEEELMQLRTERAVERMKHQMPWREV